MLNKNIYSFNDMQKRVNELSILANQQELLLKSQFHQILEDSHPLTIVKDSINSLLKDKTVQENFSTKAVSLGTNFVIEKILGRNRSIFGYFSSLLVEKYATPLIIKILPLLKNKSSKA